MKACSIQPQESWTCCQIPLHGSWATWRYTMPHLRIMLHLEITLKWGVRFNQGVLGIVCGTITLAPSRQWVLAWGWNYSSPLLAVCCKSSGLRQRHVSIFEVLLPNLVPSHPWSSSGSSPDNPCLWNLPWYPTRLHSLHVSKPFRPRSPDP